METYKINISFDFTMDQLMYSGVNITKNQIELSHNSFIIISDVTAEIKNFYEIV